MKLIEPSLLSINKKKARHQLQKIRDLNIPFVHYDVMDQKFVPCKALTTEYLKEIDYLGLKPNVHLMVVNPDKWINKYKKFNLNSITFHAETQSIAKAKQLINKIHDLGFKAGISIKTNTNLKLYKDLFKLVDIILIMSVNPGWAGQTFKTESIKNIKVAYKAKRKNKKLIIQIDGGINFYYIKKFYKYIDWFVTGSWFFKNIDNMDQYLLNFKKLIKN